MDIIKEINNKLQPIFEKRINEWIIIEKEKYIKRHPFVGTLVNGNGYTMVIDKDGVKMSIIVDWKTLTDECIKKQEDIRYKAQEDGFIQTLIDIQWHSLGFTPDNIEF